MDSPDVFQGAIDDRLPLDVSSARECFTRLIGRPAKSESWYFRYASQSPRHFIPVACMGFGMFSKDTIILCAC